jgi:hypothetical protein
VNIPINRLSNSELTNYLSRFQVTRDNILYFNIVVYLAENDEGLETEPCQCNQCVWKFSCQIYVYFIFIQVALRHFVFQLEFVDDNYYLLANNICSSKSIQICLGEIQGK